MLSMSRSAPCRHASRSAPGRHFCNLLYLPADHIGDVNDMIGPVSVVFPVNQIHYNLDDGLLIRGSYPVFPNN